MPRSAAYAVAASFFLSVPAFSQESAALKDVKLGEHLYGPELKADDLQGRVVLFEFWGIK